MNQGTLLEMLTYRRPAWSRSEERFIARYIDTIPGVYPDRYGNRILRCPDSSTIIACHTDTVHITSGRQRVDARNGVVRLPLGSKSNCLGSDDTAGVYAAMRMIEAGVQATFIFHRAEEIGGQGSAWLAEKYPEWIAQHNICLSLDRRGTGDIITSQLSSRCASDDFALSLAGQLGMGHKPARGVFTDSGSYAHLIPECSNISIGYQHEHTKQESLDLAYLEQVIARLVRVDWSALRIVRDPAEIRCESNSYLVRFQPYFDLMRD